MIQNLTKNTLLSLNTFRVNGFFDRMRGMIGRRFITFDAMLFDRCSAVHTFFMGIPLDIVFVSNENKVLALYEDVIPWKFCISCRKARYVVELPVNSIKKSKTECGDVLDLNACTVTDKYKKTVFSDNNISVAGSNAGSAGRSE